MNKLDIKRLDLKSLARFRRVILIGAVVVLLAVNGFLATGYVGALGTKRDLENEIALKETQIAQLEGRYNIGALERDLAEAQRVLVEEAPFPDPQAEEISNINVAKSIIDTAQDARVTCFTFEPGTVTTTKIGDNSYLAKRFSIAITTATPLSRLINFLSLIEELPYNTLSIFDVDLVSAEEGWQLSFKMQIITQGW